MKSANNASLPTRILGKTGQKVPVFGLGTGEGGMGLDDADAVRLYQKAIDSGVTYIDTAPGYDNAQSQLAQALDGRRKDVFLATKVPTANGKAFADGLEDNLATLKTDYVDVAYIHAVGDQDIEELLSQDGSLCELLRAKKRGLARFVGFTAHNRTGYAERILNECSDLDVVMFAMNFVERNVYGFEDAVLPIAVEQNLGVAAMKVYGGAAQMEYHQPVESAMTARGNLDHHLAFRYALSLPGVALNVIGVYTPEELEQNIEWAQSFVPLSADERQELEVIGRAAAETWGERYGVVE
jgi:uncharacterized protein